MKILVTGGAGFIGSHLVDRLIELDHQVIVIDNLSADNEKFYFNDNAIYHKLDISDYDSTHKLYENIDYVFHMAAESRLRSAIANPINTVIKNSVGTCTVLECCRNYNVKKIIFSSTSSIYGNNKFPNNELQPSDPLNPYSVSKLSGEHLCKMYTDLYGLKTIIFRYFNVFGEREPRKGNYATVIGTFLRQRGEGINLTIVGDGLQRRDFVHVSDIVNVNILAMNKNIDDNQYGKIYNVGLEKNISVLEIAESISNNYEFIPFREGEMEVTLSDSSRVKKVFGWNPEVDPIEWIKLQRD